MDAAPAVGAAGTAVLSTFSQNIDDTTGRGAPVGGGTCELGSHRRASSRLNVTTADEFLESESVNMVAAGRLAFTRYVPWLVR